MKALFLALAAVSLSAADLTGIWLGQLPARPGGDPADIAIQIVQSGSKISGKLYGDYKSHPIVEGVISGDLVTFVVLASEQAGNQINESRLRFTGSIKDGVLELARERESSANAGNGGGVQLRQFSARLIIKLKRLT